MLHPRFAEMHLRIDHAGEQMQAGTVDGGLRRVGVKRPNPGDATGPDPDIGPDLAAGRHNGPAAQHQIKRLVHSLPISN